MDYFVTAEIEVLREASVSIIAKLTKYMIKNDIAANDAKDPVSILLNKVYKLSESLISENYSIEELNEVKTVLKFIKGYADDVIKNNELN